MSTEHVPSISELVDQMTVMIEYADQRGFVNDATALRQSRGIVVEYVFRETRVDSWFQRVKNRIALRQRKVAA